jgi:hypothetical protein
MAASNFLQLGPFRVYLAKDALALVHKYEAVLIIHIHDI